MGRGSIFEVALLETDGTRCVGKRIRSRMLGEDLAKHAFGREHALLSAVEHPSVPRLIDVGEDQAGPYLLESWAEGVSLRLWSEARRSANAQVSQAAQIALANRSFGRLAEFHALADESGALELVHGDLSPDHIIIADNGDVAFIDFGQSSGRGLPHPLAVGERGTMPYAAPERLRGEGASQAGDVYALAACFAFLALGRSPIEELGSDAALLVQLAEQGLDASTLAPLVDPPAAQESAWLRALRLEPEQRPNAKEVSDWLGAARPASPGTPHSS